MSHRELFERRDPVQLRFAAYLISAIHNRKVTISRNRQTQCSYEVPMVTEEEMYQNNSDMKTEEDPYDIVSTVLAIKNALTHASKRDRLIFYARFLDNRDYGDIGQEHGLSYKGAAAAYNRLIHRIIAELGGGKK